MPSFSRLLVLAVLGVSVCVQAAPLPEGTSLDILEAAKRDLVTVDDLNERHADDDDAEFLDVDEDDGDEDDGEEDDDDADVEDDAEVEDDDDVEDEDVEDEPEDDGAELVRRKVKAKAPKKTAPKVVKPKVVKPPKAKTTKAAAKPKTTKAVAKTTKAAAKTTKAAAKTTKAAAKTTKAVAKTTKAAAKTTKAAAKTTKAAAKTTAKATAKVTTKATAKATQAASKTTKAASSKITSAKSTASASASACPIKPKTTPKTTKAAKKPLARAYDYVSHLFERDTQEFVGWHGTNSDTAAFWAQKGQLEKPTKASGLFDFNLFGPKSKTSGTSGADAEIGPGVYVTDDQDIAIAFANNNAAVNPGTTAQLCAIFAKSQDNWRTALRKAFIPENLVGDSANPVTKASKENARLDHIKKAVPGVSAPSVVKFSLLNRKTKTGQLVLPATITNQFTAKCFAAEGGAAAAGTSKFPAFSYNGNTLRSEWNIAAETAGDCA